MDSLEPGISLFQPLDGLCGPTNSTLAMSVVLPVVRNVLVCAESSGRHSDEAKH